MGGGAKDHVILSKGVWAGGAKDLPKLPDVR